MICERCQGAGGIRVLRPMTRSEAAEMIGTSTAVDPNWVVSIPCPECGGSGVAHCCDGLTACNDAETATERDSIDAG